MAVVSSATGLAPKVTSGAMVRWSASGIGGLRRFFLLILPRFGRVVGQHRRESAGCHLHGNAGALGIVKQLIALHAANAEIGSFGMSEIPAAHRRRWQHGMTFGQGNACLLFRVQQLEQRRLLAMV